MFRRCVLCVAASSLSACALAEEFEGSLPASRVLPGATVFTYTARDGDVLSGFYVRLANCVGPREEPIVAAVRLRGELLPERVAIPVFPFPLVEHTRPHGPVSPPLDIGQEYREAFAPIRLQKDERVSIEIVSTKPVRSGVTTGFQFQGRHLLSGMRNPFRESRLGGPVCRIPWEPSEIITVGTQEKFDPACAPQNNSPVIADEDGTLFQFTAYYSVDEQYGGGRGGSYSRVFGFRKQPGAAAWEPLGIIVDVHEGKTYSGDPFVFRDLDGVPCLVYTVADGTDGFADWKVLDTFLMRSTTRSFAGPWAKPRALFEGYPRNPDDNKTGGRANCVRIYTREKTQDYVFIWTHGAQDMDIRGVVLPSLDATLTHEQIGNAPILVKNQEEGGGGFQRGGKGYLSTWQIPWINDPTGLQRVYEFDLDDPLNPESWRAVPGSVGMNDGTVAFRDGGCTADSWAVSAIGDDLWATSCEWSVTNQKNYLLAHRVKAVGDNFFWPAGDVFRYGAVRVERFHEIVPVVEYALGEQCAFEMTFTGLGKEAYGFLMIAPSARPLFYRSVGLEVGAAGSRLVAYRDDATAIPLTEYGPPVWESGREYRMKLVRRGSELSGYVDEAIVGAVTIGDAAMLESLREPQRFKLYGWQGGSYSISGAAIIDGPESR